MQNSAGGGLVTCVIAEVGRGEYCGGLGGMVAASWHRIAVPSGLGHTYLGQL